MEQRDQKEITAFKRTMAKWLRDLSICFNTDVQEMSKEQLKTMVEMIVRLIIANKMTFELEPYSSAIRLIASGDVDIYRLNIVSLMKVFREECERYKRSKKPEKW